MLKLRRRVVRHFVTLIEICMHLIRVNPGHICLTFNGIFFFFFDFLLNGKAPKLS